MYVRNERLVHRGWWETQFHAVPPNVIPSTTSFHLFGARPTLNTGKNNRISFETRTYENEKEREGKLLRALALVGNELDLEMIYLLFIGWFFNLLTHEQVSRQTLFLIKVACSKYP
jgi:hypothetical protein